MNDIVLAIGAHPDDIEFLPVEQFLNLSKKARMCIL